MQTEKKKSFDLTTHVRDGKGTIIKSQPYRLYLNGNNEEFERPPGSGWFYTRAGDLLRKPSDKQIKAQESKEFTNDQLMKQIEDLKAKLEENKSNDSFLALEKDEEDEMSSVVPVEQADNSEEIALMEAAGAIEDAQALKALPQVSKFNKPNFIKK